MMTTSALICLAFGILAGIGWTRSFYYQRAAKRWESYALGLRSELNKWSAGKQ
jgi:hypothetical protein